VSSSQSSAIEVEPSFSQFVRLDSGTLVVGHTLNVEATCQNCDPSSLTYTWFIDGIQKGSGNSYTMQENDQNRAIIVDAVVLSTNHTLSKKVSLTINRPAPILTKLERLDEGNLILGHRLIVKAYCQGCLSGELQYNWFVADMLVGNSDNYLIKPEDLNKKIRVDAVSFTITGTPYRTATMEFTPLYVTNVFSNAMFGFASTVNAALKNDGSLISWGYSSHGGGQTLSNVSSVASTMYAIAVLKNDGTVETFGDSAAGGDSTGKNLVNVKFVAGGSSAFAALRNDGTVATWGAATFGGNSSGLNLTNVKTLAGCGSCGRFIALKNDGTLVEWGTPHSTYVNGVLVPNITASNLTNIKSVFLNRGNARAAVRNDGTAVAWGAPLDGGDSSGINLTNINTIYSTERAFAALKNDGTVVTWGRTDSGGDSTGKDLTGIASIASSTDGASSGAFAALKNDGRVITWGANSVGGNGGNLDLTNVKQVIGFMQSRFLALKNDGSVVIWGSGFSNGTNLYASGVTELVSLSGGGAIIKKSDGSVIVEPYQAESGTPTNALFSTAVTNTHP
jgi:hypothetical protein